MWQGTKSILKKKSLIFLYTKDEASEKEIRKAIPILFYCSIKNNKILKNKEVEIPYNENNKILLKKKSKKTQTNGKTSMFVDLVSQFSHSVMSNSLRTHKLHHTRPPCLSPTPGAYSNSCPSSQ